MRRTINFCGDSFCAGLEPGNWCDNLASRLGAKVVGKGKPSTAYEYAIKCFDPSADYTVFLWTESHRLYHRKLLCTYRSGVKHFNNLKPVELLSATAEIFYRQFYDKEYFDELQMRSLYWFDKEVLADYKGTAIHLFCFEKTYHFENGLNVDHIMADYKEEDDVDGSNHYSFENNSWFASKLYETITNS